MKLFFTFLLIGLVSCDELQPVSSNLEELNVDEPDSIPEEVLLDLDELHFKTIIDDEDAMLAMVAHANPVQVTQGITLCKTMLAKNNADNNKNVKARKKIGQEKARLGRILRLFQGMLKSGANKDLLGGKWLAQRRPAKNKLLRSGFNITKQWRLSFKLYQWGKVRNWGNLVHFTSGSNGNRVPAIWLHPNGNQLHMCMWTKASTNDCWNSPALALKRWHSIVMMQRRNANGSYSLTYWIDGRKKFTKVQARPQAFRNLKVYAGDPWYASPYAYVKNVQMINL